MADPYRRWRLPSIRWRIAAVVPLLALLSAAALGSSLLLVPLVGTELMPEADEGEVTWGHETNVGYFARTRGGGRVRTVGPLYEGQQYGIALAEGSQWLEAVNRALAAMRADGTYAKLYERYRKALSRPVPIIRLEEQHGDR